MNQIKCAQCDGAGWYARQIDDAGNAEQEQCRECNGAGVIPSVDPEECWVCDACEGSGVEDATMTEATRLIPLTQGKYAIVDASDYEWLSQWKWHAFRVKDTQIWYAQSNVRGKDGKRTTVFMHRVIAGTPDDMHTDHIDGNGLNNSRTNLRICTYAENMWNSSIRRNNTSGYKGVSWDKQRAKWQVMIRINGNRFWLGRFDTAEDAARAYNKAAIELHGEFAQLNEVSA